MALSGPAPCEERVDPSALIAGFDLGDPRARGALVEIIYTTAFSVLGRYREDARGAALEAVLDDLIEGGGVSHFDPAEGSFAGWLALILKRRAIEYLRAHAPKSPLDPRDPISLSTPIACEGDDLTLEDVIASQPMRDDGLTEVEHQVDVNAKAFRAMAALTPQQQLVIQLTAEGYSSSEIGEMLSLSASYVRSIREQARARAKEAVSTDD